MDRLVGNERYREIFRRLVEVYIETGQPVGSLALSKTLDNPLSPATIRNVMADLEELGILCSDHVSAGRRPTEKGWRVFVNGLVEASNISEIERHALAEISQTATGKSVESILASASEVLSRLSNCVSLVATPTFSHKIRHIDFVLLSPGRAIVIIVNDRGLVENRLIDVSCDISAAVLERASQYINTKYSGLSLEEIRDGIQKDADYQKAGIDSLTKSIVEQGLGFVSDGNERIIVRGQSNLVGKSDEIEMLQELLNRLDEQQAIKSILDQSIIGQGVQIFIGAETKMFEMSGCSLIVSSYRDEKKNLIGALGVVGPARLRYNRIIPLVDYTAKLIGSLLSPT